MLVNIVHFQLCAALITSKYHLAVLVSVVLTFLSRDKWTLTHLYGFRIFRKSWKWEKLWKLGNWPEFSYCLMYRRGELFSNYTGRWRAERIVSYGHEQQARGVLPETWRRSPTAMTVLLQRHQRFLMELSIFEFYGFTTVILVSEILVLSVLPTL